MAEKAEPPVNPEQAVTNPPAPIRLSTDDHLRNLTQRVDKLAEEVSRLSKPPLFRVADMAELAAIVIGLVLAGFTALGLSERIGDVRAQQADSERRLDGRIDAAQIAISAKLDRLADQFTRMDERTSKLEGEKEAGGK